MGVASVADLGPAETLSASSTPRKRHCRWSRLGLRRTLTGVCSVGRISLWLSRIRCGRAFRRAAGLGKIEEEFGTCSSPLMEVKVVVADQALLEALRQSMSQVQQRHERDQQGAARAFW